MKAKREGKNSKKRNCVITRDMVVATNADTSYTEYIKGIEKNIPKLDLILRDRDLDKIFEPIKVERAYVSGIANPDTNLYYSRQFEKDMFQKYSDAYKGCPPLVLRNPEDYRKSMNDFIYVRSESMLGYIVECKPTYFMVEPKGVRSRSILEYIVKNGYKAVYEFLSQTRQTCVYDGKTDNYIEVNELYGRSKIVCVNMVKK